MVSDEFKRNVESGDVVTVRSALVDYLIIDISFRQFDEALAFAGQSLDVMESENGQQEYDDNPNNWNEQYLNQQKVALMVNFSQKRIDHLKEVIRTVLGAKTMSTEVTMADMDVETRKKECKTGRIVLSEEPEESWEKDTRSDINTLRAQNIPKTEDRGTGSSHFSKESRTGRKTLVEKKQGVTRTEEEVHPIDIAAWMIGGGVTVAAIGGVTVGIGSAVAKSAVVHTGMVAVRAGAVVAVSGGGIKLIKNIKER